MARVLVVNPNTSTAMTEGIDETARRVAGPDTEIVTVRPDIGPESLESFYEYHLGTTGVLEALREYDDVDGVVIACYGDPGFLVLKEVGDAPVVGVAESSIATVTLLGHKFAILVALERAVPMMEMMVRSYGLGERLATVETTSMSVLDFEEDTERTVDALTEAGERACGAGADVLILGCSGLTDLDSRLQDRLGVPVIDPIADAVKTVEKLIDQGLSQSRAGLYQSPPEKVIRGDVQGDLRR